MTQFPRKNKNGEIVFKDYPDFRPNLTPREVALQGFCRGYWRRVYSTVAKRYLEEDDYKKYPFLKDLPKEIMTVNIDEPHDHSVNKYGVHASSTLQFWEKSGWIRPPHYRGNYEWYCDFYMGKRNKSVDEYQIKRWQGVAGKTGRFKKNLIRQIYYSKKSFKDSFSVSPKIRQVLLHWYYELTEKDYKQGIKELLEKRKNIKKK